VTLTLNQLHYSGTNGTLKLWSRQSFKFVVLLCYWNYCILIHQLRTAKAFLHVACLRTPWFDRSPPLHVLTSRDTSGEDRAPRDMMVLPCEWAPSTACNSEKGRKTKIHSFFQMWWLHIQHAIHTVHIYSVKLLSLVKFQSNTSVAQCPSQYTEVTAASRRVQTIHGAYL